MEFTGERVIPGQVDPDLWAEHFSRYRFAADLAQHLNRSLAVLDIGSGSGYGTAALAEVATSATGIDLSSEAVDYAREHYNQPHLTFVPGSATDLPFPDQSFDLITAFEVIEHLADPAKLLSEARRVLRHDGLFLVSTPNKTYYAETRGSKGPNPYHLHEFAFDEFRAALASAFPVSEILQQNHTDAFSFSQANVLATDAVIENISGSSSDAHFFIAVCSSAPIRDLRNFVYVPTATNLLRTREHHIGLLQAEVSDLKSSIDTLQASLSTAHAERDKLLALFEQQTQELAQRTEWAQRAEREFNIKVEHLKIVMAELESSQAALAQTAERVRQLDATLHAAYDQMRETRDSRWMKLGRKLNLGPNLSVPDTPESAPSPETKRDV
jgi:SAM-dependent methyltransferase